MPRARLVGLTAAWLGTVAAVGWSQPAAKDVDAWEKEGLWHHDAGDYEKAIQAFRQGLELEPQNLTLIYELSNPLHSAGRLAEARSESPVRALRGGKRFLVPEQSARIAPR